MFTVLPDFPSYEINKEGVVRRRKDQKILSTELRRGYLSVHLHKDGKGKHCLLHRLLAERFIPNPNHLPTVDHLNRNKTDNRLENLMWKSRSDQNLNRGRCLKGTNTNEPNIHFCERDTVFVVQLQKDFVRYKRNFQTLDEAISFRNQLLNTLKLDG